MNMLKKDFQILYKKARKEQLDIARKILNNNEWITEFCNAMGSYSFEEILDPNTPDEREVFVDNDDERISEMEDFMQEWDEVFHFSGDPIYIVKNNFDCLDECTDW